MEKHICKGTILQQLGDTVSLLMDFQVLMKVLFGDFGI